MKRKTNAPTELDLKHVATKALKGSAWVEHGAGGTGGYPDGTFQMKDGDKTRTCYIELKRFVNSPFRPAQIKVIKDLIANGATVFMGWMDKGSHLPYMAQLMGFDGTKPIITPNAMRLSEYPVKAAKFKKF